MLKVLTVGAEDASTRGKGIFFFRKETEAADVQLPLKL